MHRTGVTGAELVYKKGLEASTKKSVEMDRAKRQSRSAPLWHSQRGNSW